MPRRSLVFLAPFALAALAGCTTLLGDFGSGGAGADGGSVDGTTADVTGTDGSVDGAAADGGKSDGNGATDAGDAGADAPVEAGCEAGTLDCNGACVPNGPTNCGTCGHDCTHLSHVSGSVGCSATGACTFDAGACAPGYGICSTNPDNGCDTDITQPTHCGDCTTQCTGGTPACSPSGDAGTAFGCSSGCATGLSLCTGSCVNEGSDPNHCGSCTNVCPGVTGGTPACSPGGVCGFTCNTGDHLCGTGASASCPSNTDPNNCGSLCGTNCPGPTSGSGAASCNGNSCAITCGAGLSPCGTACVNESTDDSNCGGCGTTCSTGQTCSGGHCVCNVNTCPSGCCDTLGQCQAAPSCGSGGVACAAGCPITAPEASSLVLWLVGEDYNYASGSPIWKDRSTYHHDGSCATLACPGDGTVNGHPDVGFGGIGGFALADQGADLAGNTFTFFFVIKPNASAAAYDQLFALYNGGDYVKFQRSNTANNVDFQVIPGNSGANYITTQSGGSAWAGNWVRLQATIDASGYATMNVYNNPMGISAGSQGTIGAPAYLNWSGSYVGTSPASPGSGSYWGEIAEIIVYSSASLSSTTVTGVEGYLTTRYGF